jgi:hypothetical protein
LSRLWTSVKFVVVAPFCWKKIAPWVVLLDQIISVCSSVSCKPVFPYQMTDASLKTCFGKLPTALHGPVPRIACIGYFA